MLIFLLLIVVLFTLAAFFLIWVLKTMANKCCPNCQSPVIPIIPAFLAWCPECGENISHSDLVEPGAVDPEEIPDFSESAPKPPQF